MIGSPRPPSDRSRQEASIRRSVARRPVGCRTEPVDQPRAEAILGPVPSPAHRPTSPQTAPDQPAAPLPTQSEHAGHHHQPGAAAPVSHASPPPPSLLPHTPTIWAIMGPDPARPPAPLLAPCAPRRPSPQHRVCLGSPEAETEGRRPEIRRRWLSTLRSRGAEATRRLAAVLGSAAGFPAGFLRQRRGQGCRLGERTRCRLEGG
jgi:hypothetical protein